jgi:hypothetical protein
MNVITLKFEVTSSSRNVGKFKFILKFDILKTLSVKTLYR